MKHNESTHRSNCVRKVRNHLEQNGKNTIWSFEIRLFLFLNWKKKRCNVGVAVAWNLCFVAC